VDIARRAAGSTSRHNTSVDAEQRDRGEQAAQAHATGAHRDDLDVSRHPSDREQHAEQERDRQRVDREHRAEQAHHAQHVFARDARADQLIEHANEAARDHHDCDRREADQGVGHDLARHVQGQGAGPAHSRLLYPFHYLPPPARESACPEPTSVASNA